MSASLRPETTANATPSRSVSIAAMVAFFASAILVTGFAIEPEQSIMMTWAAVGGALSVRNVPPEAVTVTTASTTVPPAGRYWFWETSALKAALLIHVLLGLGWVPPY